MCHRAAATVAGTHQASKSFNGSTPSPTPCSVFPNRSKFLVTKRKEKKAMPQLSSLLFLTPEAMEGPHKAKNIDSSFRGDRRGRLVRLSPCLDLNSPWNLNLIPFVIIALVICNKISKGKTNGENVDRINSPLWLTFLFRADRAAASAEAMSLPPPGETPAGGSPLPCGPVSPPPPPTVAALLSRI